MATDVKKLAESADEHSNSQVGEDEFSEEEDSKIDVESVEKVVTGSSLMKKKNKKANLER